METILIVYFTIGTFILIAIEADQIYYTKEFSSWAENLLIWIFWPIVLSVMLFGIIQLAFFKGDKHVKDKS